MLIIVVGTGFYYTFRLEFLQFRKFTYAWKTILGGLDKLKYKKDAGAGSVTPMQV